ncbi:MAG: M1 family metallopeptidase [Haliscomenobacter sp.]|nr:M1 family metallopeptidase [Haliscomenobacter sp.]
MRSVKLFFVLGAFFLAGALPAQPDRWQQRVQYKMDVDFDATTHQYQGNQHLTYFNNSPDTLYKVFYHLYFNAFQPGSMMDVRSRTISDPDRRVRDRIFNLKPDEVGFVKVQSLKQNGSPVSFETVETILEVSLAKPILPGQKAVFEMEFQGQVPIQIRRSGRNNREGIAYSMAQWYPKLCEYDYQGWHANPYIAREFYGVWGDFDVAIHLDKKYVIGATGYLQNPEEVGHGYETAGMKMKLPKGDKLTWRFHAPNVHDFVWAADPEYSHTTLVRPDGLALHFFFQKNEKTEKTWAALPAIMDRVFDYANRRFGQYQFKKYSFIQGGDGGMEYPMATLILGEGNLNGLVGVSVHELMHSWYQMTLGTNESLYAWMDEGFTDYATDEIMNFLKKEGLIPGEAEAFPWAGNYNAYFALAKSGLEEPLTTHADHFNTNRAYGTGSYSKGSVFLKQLEYVVGKQAFDQGLLKYFYTWKMKHPNANDFIRIMEKASGLELDWYKEYFVHTTATIDYGVKSVEESDGKTLVTLERAGRMPMPLDVVVTYTDGAKEVVTIPLQMMRGNKAQEASGTAFRVAADWPWVNPSYSLVLPVAKSRIARIEIDPSFRMADINRANNLFE